MSSFELMIQWVLFPLPSEYILPGDWTGLQPVNVPPGVNPSDIYEMPPSKPLKKFRIGDFELKKVLGKGSFGKVLLAKLQG